MKFVFSSFFAQAGSARFLILTEKGPRNIWRFLLKINRSQSASDFAPEAELF